MTRLQQRSVDQHGAALVIALLIALLVGASVAALVTLTTTETAISAGYRHVQEAMHGAEAAMDLSLHHLSALPDWSAVLSAPPSNQRASFADGAMFPVAPDGRRLDLAALTVERQRDSDARDGPGMFGPDNPQWRLYGHAPLDDVLPAPRLGVPIYLVVWVADDGLDGDGDPQRDANGIVVVRADAFGTSGARRGVEAAVLRSERDMVRLLTWREVR